MATKTIGRIYLQREKDIVHILTIKANTDKGDVYFSSPMSKEANDIGVRNMKLSYHKDGKTHVTSEIDNLEKIDEITKRNNTKGLGFNAFGDKVYNFSEKKLTLSEIKGFEFIGRGMSYININDKNHSVLKEVAIDKVEQDSGIINSKNYQNLTLLFYINAPKLSINPEIMWNGDNNFFVFPHPSLDLSILVQAVDMID